MQPTPQIPPVTTAASMTPALDAKKFVLSFYLWIHIFSSSFMIIIFIYLIFKIDLKRNQIGQNIKHPMAECITTTMLRNRVYGKNLMN